MITLGGFKPSTKAWDSLSNSLGSFKGKSFSGDNLALRADFSVKGSDELLALIRSNKFKHLSEFDLLMLISIDFWDELDQEEAKSLASSFWRYYSKNSNLAVKVYYWYFSKKNVFKKPLNVAAKECKSHPHLYSQCMKGYFDGVCREMFQSDGAPVEFFLKQNLPFAALLKLARFRKSIAKVYWEGHAGQNDLKLVQVLNSATKPDEKYILNFVLKERLDNKVAHKADQSLKKKLIAHFDVEAIDKYYAKLRFAQMTDMLLFREQQNFISIKDTSQFVACGFPRLPDHSDNKEKYQKWLKFRYGFASSIQFYFKHSFLITQDYYRALVQNPSASKQVAKANPVSDYNFIILINRSGVFVVIYLPNNTKPHFQISATIGEISDEARLLHAIESGLVCFNWLKRNARITGHIDHGPGWNKVLANELIQRNLVEEKALEWHLNHM